MSGMELNTIDFDKKFKRLVEKAMPEAMHRGMGIAVNQLMNDTVMEEPAVPLEDGTLRGSGSGFVDKKLVGTTKDLGKDGTPSTTHNESIKADAITGIVGFNTPYAARHHEVPANFKTAGTGNDYLRAKLIRNRVRYMGNVADEIKKAK